MKDMQEHLEEQDSEDELDYDLSSKKVQGLCPFCCLVIHKWNGSDFFHFECKTFYTIYNILQTYYIIYNFLQTFYTVYNILCYLQHFVTLTNILRYLHFTTLYKYLQTLYTVYILQTI